MSDELDPTNTTGEHAAAPDPLAADGAKVPGGVYGLLFPPDPYIWAEARRIGADKKARVEDLAAYTAQDPAMVLELLRTANAMFYAGGKSQISSTKAAILRLGADQFIDLLDKMKERPAIEDPKVADHFNQQRGRCKRTAILAKMLAEIMARPISEDCQTAALLLHSGEMLAVMHLQEEYVELAEDSTRSNILYRLHQDHKFDVEKMGLAYLRRQGVPDILLAALDREGRTRSPERVLMKPLCFAAGEMLEAFDCNRWEKIAPGKQLSPKSFLRSLQIPEAQYLKIYERASEYLFAMKLSDEKQKQIIQEQIEDEEEEPQDEDAGSLQSEIDSLLLGGRRNAAAAKSEPPAPVATPKQETQIKSVDVSFNKLSEQFSLKRTTEPKEARVPQVAAPIAPPLLATKKGTGVVNNIAKKFDEAASSEELISTLLQMLVTEGSFEKSALIVVSKDKKEAIVVAARGPSIGNGQRLQLEDPLNPIAQSFAKVQSFGNKSSKFSPFGSKSFAISPVNADHDTPVALYADCGNNGSITFEARRIFRTVVEILNQKLPQMPGGIPNELDL